MTSASKSTRAYVVGQVYTTQVDDLSVRTGPGTNNPEKSYAELSSNAQQHAHDNGRLKKGTRVTCKDVRKSVVTSGSRFQAVGLLHIMVARSM